MGSPFQFVSRFRHLTFLGLWLLPTAIATAQDYVVTSFFKSPDPLTIYTPTDFNNESMVCGEWRRFSPGFSAELERGIFLWREGTLRHLTPGQGGLPFIRPSESVVRMTNVRPDGTLLLVATASQPHTDHNGNSSQITRPVRYTIQADLAAHPRPVLSAITLGGFLDPNIVPDQSVELSVGGISDITSEGHVLGYSTSPFFYAPTLLWGPSGGNSPRWFQFDLFRSWGTPWGFDHAGHVFGSVSDLNAPPVSFNYETPLAGLGIQGGTSQTLWPDSVAGGDPDIIARPRPFAAHGPYRVAHYRPAGQNQTWSAVWTTGFQNLRIIPDFQTSYGLASLPTNRTSLTTTGHLLGTIRPTPANPSGTPGLARRQPDGSYQITPLASLAASGTGLFPPFANPSFSRPNFAFDISAINDRLDCLGNMTVLNPADGNGFYVLRHQPGPGRILPQFTPFSSSELTGANLQFTRTLGRSGPCQIRVTLTSGGTATAGQDFIEGTTGILSWADGESGYKTLTLPLLNDYAVEEQETVRVVLSNVTGAALEGPSEHFITLSNDDLALPPIPSISGPSTASGAVGASFTYNPEPLATLYHWTATGLPGGLQIDPHFGTVFGTPWQSGTFPVTVIARNDTHASPPLNITLTINPSAPGAPLLVTSPRRATARAGQPFTYQFTLSGSWDSRLIVWANPPEGVFSLLPPGWSFNATTGLLTGTPSNDLVGPLTFGLNATRGEESAIQLLEIEVAPATGPLTPVQRWLRTAGLPDRPPLADPDGNGITTLMEYACGLTPGARPVPVIDPNALEPAPGLPAVAMDYAAGFGNPRMAVTYFRSAEALAAGLTYTVEFTFDFLTWTPAPGGARLAGNSLGDLIRTADPTPGPLVTSPRYYRLKVTSPPP